MTSFRVAIAAALFSLLFAGCGETFRPIATVVPGTPPATQAAKTAIVLSDNGTASTSRHFNLSGNTETGSAPVGQGPNFAVYAGLVGRIYVSNRTDNTLTSYAVLNPQGGTTTVTLPASSNPASIEANLNSSSVYVALQGRDSVGVVNTATNTLAAEIALPASAAPIALISSLDGTKIYTANSGTNSVSVISLATNSVTGTVNFGGGCTSPRAFAIHNTLHYVYVVCSGSNNVFLINTDTDAYTDVPPIAVGSSPVAAAFDANRKRLIVTNSGSNTISVLNEDPAAAAGTGHTVTTVPVGSTPIGAVPLADGTKVYVANSASNNVTVVDSATLTVKTTIPVPSPNHIAASGDSTRVAVTGSSGLVSIDATTDTVNTTFPLTGTPSYLLLLQL